MNKIKLFAMFLPFALLSACGLMPMLMGAPLPAPASAANNTVLDEQLATTVELAYQTEAELLAIAGRAGFLTADQKAKLRDLDNRAYRAVLATRAAYKAGNAPDYFSAASEARSAIAQTVSVIKGN